MESKSPNYTPIDLEIYRHHRLLRLMMAGDEATEQHPYYGVERGGKFWIVRGTLENNG
ncbi:MAG: hypothetical protein ACO3EZ_06160 [Prochlorotrichaceae cyanobacterium]